MMPFDQKYLFEHCYIRKKDELSNTHIFNIFYVEKTKETTKKDFLYVLYTSHQLCITLKLVRKY